MPTKIKQQREDREKKLQRLACQAFEQWLAKRGVGVSAKAKTAFIAESQGLHGMGAADLEAALRRYKL
jgi:hypothetical protein